jgi:hypothetical protein
MRNENRGWWPGALALGALLVLGCSGEHTTFPDGRVGGEASEGSCLDGRKNQDESDVDCGGALCSACLDGKACTADRDCKSRACSKGVCRSCKAGGGGCLGNLVRTCAADESSWTTVATCDPAKGQVCDAASKSCQPIKVVGTPNATGTYYLYTMFTTGKSAFKGGYDVDSIVTTAGDGAGNLIYVNRSSQLDVYKVELVDSDGDGKLEPNQHPENAKAKGPVEERKLTFIKTYTNVTLGQPSIGELYAAADRVYFQKRAAGSNGSDIHEFILATGLTNLVVPAHPKAAMCLLGFDETTKRWYAANDQKVDGITRRVYSYNPEGGGWAAEFDWPNLAGGHGDGMEVVVDPKTSTPYVYVSDMTSDFIAQYYRDPSTGAWIQKNVFKYMETAKQSVEGMGFGAFQHFWITSGSALYEVGGGDIQDYVGPD